MEIVNFTPIPSLLGGMLIGLSATLLLLLNGRIAGISGICKSVLQKQSASDFSWRFLFIIGMIIGGSIYAYTHNLNLTANSMNVDLTKLIIAAVLVGVGTSFGNGCTSGHGICGLSRRSKRSLIATLVFMLFGMLTVLIIG